MWSLYCRRQTGKRGLFYIMTDAAPIPCKKATPLIFPSTEHLSAYLPILSPTLTPTDLRSFLTISVSSFKNGNHIFFRKMYAAWPQRNHRQSSCRKCNYSVRENNKIKDYWKISKTEFKEANQAKIVTTSFCDKTLGPSLWLKGALLYEKKIFFHWDIIDI